MKQHEYYEELVNLKVDGILTPEQETELDAHLSVCGECRERLDLYAMIHSMSDDLLEEPPENFAGGVMYRIGLEKKQNSFKRLLTARIFTIAGAAAAIALLVWSGTIQSIFPINRAATESARIAADSAMAGEAAPVASPDEKGGTVAESPMLQQSQTAPADSAAADAASGADNTAKESEGESDSPMMFGFAAPSLSASNVFDPKTILVGDLVAGFTVTDAQVNDNGDTKDVKIEFSGTATLSGTLYYDNDENGHWGKFLYFYIDDDCAELLPYPADDDRAIWFGIENFEDIVGKLEVNPEDEGSTISYKAMIVIDGYTVIQNSSEGCNFSTLKEIVTIDRIYQ
jgi:anti-sigma factor RsiW